MNARTLLEVPLVYLAWLLRHAAALGALVLAGRAFWLSVELVTPSPSSEPVQARARPKLAAEPATLERPDFEDLQRLAGMKGGAAEEKSETLWLKRSVAVDFGPARSDVYLNGRKVGQTPFAGEVSCREGDRVRVVVMPKRGAPREREMKCMESAAPWEFGPGVDEPESSQLPGGPHATRAPTPAHSPELPGSRPTPGAPPKSPSKDSP